MSDLIPPLAANAVARLLTDNVKRPDGGDATAFNDQRDALKAMRSVATEDHARIDQLEARTRAAEDALAALPFPFRGSS